jgi:hypothetical protein
MKRKNLILSLTAVGIFIYSLWTFIDWYQVRELKKWSKDQKSDLIGECILSIDLKTYGISSSQRADICDCYIESLIDSLSPSEMLDLQNNWPDSLNSIRTTLLEPCMKPYFEDIKYASMKDDCLKEVTPKVGEEKAVIICDCFVPYLIEKYGYDSSENLDSADIEKIKQCMNQD